MVAVVSVVPTLARSSPKRALMKVDLPALTRPDDGHDARLANLVGQSVQLAGQGAGQPGLPHLLRGISQDGFEAIAYVVHDWVPCLSGVALAGRSLFLRRSSRSFLRFSEHLFCPRVGLAFESIQIPAPAFPLQTLSSSRGCA